MDFTRKELRDNQDTDELSSWLASRAAERAAQSNESGDWDTVERIIGDAVTDARENHEDIPADDLRRASFTLRAISSTIASDFGSRFNAESVLLAAAALLGGRAQMWARMS